MNSPYKMKGHTLPGINQRSEVKNLADGRSASSPFQKKWEDMTDTEKIAYAKKQKSDAEKRNVNLALSSGVSPKKAKKVAKKQTYKN